MAGVLDTSGSRAAGDAARVGGQVTRPALLVLGHGSADADGVEEFWALARAIEVAAPSGLAAGFGFIELAEPAVDGAIDRLGAAGPPGLAPVPARRAGA